MVDIPAKLKPLLTIASAWEYLTRKRRSYIVEVIIMLLAFIVVVELVVIVTRGMW